MTLFFHILVYQFAELCQIAYKTDTSVESVVKICLWMRRAGILPVCDSKRYYAMDKFGWIKERPIPIQPSLYQHFQILIGDAADNV